MADPCYDNVVIQLLGETWAGLRDSSRFPNDLNCSGGVALSSADGVPSILFTSGVVSTSLGFSLGGVDQLCIDAWVYPLSMNSPSIIFWGRGDLASQAGNSAYLMVRPSLSSEACGVNYNGSNNVMVLAPAPPVGVWSHIALTIGDGYVRTWLNGNLVAATGFAGVVNIGSSVFPTSIGALPHDIGGDTYAFDGHIRRLRVTKGVSRWAAQFDPPQDVDYNVLTQPGASAPVVPALYSPQNTASQQPGPPPSALKPVPALRRDIYFGGAGRVAGVTTVNGVATSKRVWLQEKASKLVIAQTWSAANGTYEFNNVDPEREYVVFSDDHTKVYNAVVSDRVVPA